MAALVECGFQRPWRWAHHEWEGAFNRVWSQWGPHKSEVFPRLAAGGSADGRTSEARAILWELKRTSPFAEFKTERLAHTPFGMTAREYLTEWCEGAAADEWVELAGAFLVEMEKRTPTLR